MKRIRKYFAFLFRHSFKTMPPRIEDGEVLVVLKCEKCENQYSYPILDRRAFVEHFRMTGCVGNKPDIK